MCPRFGVLVAFAAVVATPVLAGQTFPYKACVTTNDVYVRSGPGESYYPTAKLPAGAEVEVYRHDPGGWCAIRPPQGSFSWVSARHMKTGKDGLGEVTGDRVAARVGSQLSDIRDVIQVRLERGEAVELSGKQQPSGSDTAAMWYKISPPSGEFRWVHGKYIDPDYPRDGVRKASTEPRPLPSTGRKTAGTGAKSPEALPRWNPNASAPAGSTGGRITSAGATGSSRRSGRGEELAWPSPAPARRLTAEEFRTELDDINTELSIMLVEDPAVWNCEELERRAKALLDQAETAEQRGHARVLVNRIAHAQDVRRSSDAVAAAPTGLERRTRRLADIAASNPGRSGVAEGQFDSVGRLTRVQSPKLGAPRYALVDDQGNILTYVSPAPGINMQYYLGRRIGINGVRGHVADQDAELLTAKNVRTLDGQTPLRR
jgi:hypothetical protein